MTEPPLLARALLRAAEMLSQATDRLWVDAMRGDLDAAHADGRALSWAFGCLVAAVRLRAVAMFVLTPRWRRALVLLIPTLLGISAYAFIYHGATGKWPFTFVGFLVVLVPFLAIGAVGVLRGERIIVDDRFIRRSLLLFAVLGATLVGSWTLTLSARGGFWTSIAAAVSNASPLFVCSAIVGTLATLTAAILLSMKFRSLPQRIPRILPHERRFVLFWGADREKMLALADAGAPEMTLPRGWLINSTVLSAFLLLQAGVQLLNASVGHGLMLGNEPVLAYECALAAALCVANLLHLIAHLRFARHAR